MRHRLFPLAFITVLFLACPAAASVVAIYSFDGQNDVPNGQDSSGNGNHATANGTASFTSSDSPFSNNTGHAFEVTSGRNFSAPENTSAPDDAITLSEFSTQMTVSFWIKLDASNTPDWTRYIRKGTESSGETNILINRNGSTTDINTRIDTAGANGTYNQNRAQTSTNVLDNEWHLLTYVYSISALNTAGAGIVIEYLDGIKTNGVNGQTFNPGNGLGNSNNLVFGSGLGGSGTNGGNWTGLMDDLGLWNHALTEGEARSIYTLATHASFGYDLEQVTQLHELHAEGAGSDPLLLGGYAWEYVDGLSGHNPGDMFLNDDNFWVLQLDNASGLVATPEPGRFMLLGFAAMGWLVRRRR